MINITAGTVPDPLLRVAEKGLDQQPAPVVQPSILIAPNSPEITACLKSAANYSKSFGGLLVATVVGAVAAYYVPKVLSQFEQGRYPSDNFEGEDEYDLEVD